MEALWGKLSLLFTVFEYTVLAVLLYTVGKWCLNYFITYGLARFLPLSADVKKCGSWAVVTGASDGMGKGFAEEVAAKGLNVVLISRTLSKLETLAKEIESRYNVKTLVIAADFTRVDIYDDIKLRLAQLDIGLLINNLGIADDFPEYFAEEEDQDYAQNSVHCNVLSMVKMTQIVLPGMAKRGSGYIVNVASQAAFYTFPFISMYSSTKRFMMHFTQCMNLEYKERGVNFQCLVPFMVVSKMSRYTEPMLLIPTPNVYAKSALRTIGLQEITTGFWFHELYCLITSLFPTILMQKYMLSTRNIGREKVAAGTPRNEVFYWY